MKYQSKENWDNLTWKQIAKRLDWKLLIFAFLLTVGIMFLLVELGFQF